MNLGAKTIVRHMTMGLLPNVSMNKAQLQCDITPVLALVGINCRDLDS
jgi:hypothetical protein